MWPFGVLVVDDYEPFCRIVRSMLQRADFQVIGQASDGLEAVQKAEELQPDLILLDIGLPKLNGIEAAKRMRKVAPHSRILFLSQESSPDVIQEALNLGALGYLHKPRTQGELLPAIESVLAGRQFVSSDLRGYELRESTNAQAPHRHESIRGKNFSDGRGVANGDRSVTSDSVEFLGLISEWKESGPSAAPIQESAHCCHLSKNEGGQTPDGLEGTFPYVENPITSPCATFIPSSRSLVGDRRVTRRRMTPVDIGDRPKNCALSVLFKRLTLRVRRKLRLLQEQGPLLPL